MNINDSDRFFLTHIREEIVLLDSLTPGLTIDKLLEDAYLKHCIQKSLEIIGEAAKRVSEETRSLCPSISWWKYRKLRNRLTHEYFSVDWELVWTILEDDIPVLKMCVEKLLG